MKPEISGNVAKERYNELVQIIDEKNFKFREKKDVLDILIEQEKEGKYIGLDQFFNKIEVESNVDLVGDWITIKEYDVKGETNVAKFE